jgi:hypothetical protein
MEKKTEREWQALSDRFWLWFAPAWFRWLGIISMMAVIKWLADKTGDSLLRDIYVFSIFICGSHFTAYFCRDDGLAVRWIGTRGWRYLLALLLGGAMAFLSFWLSATLVARIAVMKG